MEITSTGVTLQKRVFLAAPYAQFLCPETGTVDPTWRYRLDSLRRAFILSDNEVFSAHHNESWGAHWLEASECTPVDFLAMTQADVVCAIVGSPPSGGVLVELGWASALHKPCLIVLPTSGNCTQLVEGIGMVTPANYIREPKLWTIGDLHAIVEHTLALLESSRATSVRVEGLGYVAAYCSNAICQHS